MSRDEALSILRALREPLLARGVARAGLFGSIARDQGTAKSDVDIVITPAADKRLDLFDLGGVQTLLDEAFGRDVDVIVEPIHKPGLGRAIERDRVDVF